MDISTPGPVLRDRHEMPQAALPSKKRWKRAAHALLGLMRLSTEQHPYKPGSQAQLPQQLQKQQHQKVQHHHA